MHLLWHDFCHALAQGISLTFPFNNFHFQHLEQSIEAFKINHWTIVSKYHNKFPILWNFNKIGAKFVGFKMWKCHKIYIYIFYVNDFFFYLWCFDMKYVWFTFILNICNYCDVNLHKTMRFFCIKHSHMSFKSCVSFVCIFKILFILTIT
jgi:hypothetical protein